MSKTETVYTTKTIKVGNVTVNIHRPVLTEVERKKREADVISALGRYARTLNN